MTLERDRVHRVLDPASLGDEPATEDLERALDKAYRDGWDLVASIDGLFCTHDPSKSRKKTATKRTLLILRRSPDRVPGAGRSALVGRLSNGWTVADVVRRAAEAFGVRPVDVLSRPFSKTRHVAWARQVAAYVLRTTGLSYPEIGTALAHMDHTTAMSACRRVERDPNLLLIARSIAPANAAEVEVEETEEGLEELEEEAFVDTGGEP